MKQGLFLLVAFLFVGNIWAEENYCRCACSEFKTQGGELKLCPAQPIAGGYCEDWMFSVPRAKDKASCMELGESTNDCKGYHKIMNRKMDWVLIEGGRFHSCQFSGPLRKKK